MSDIQSSDFENIYRVSKIKESYKDLRRNKTAANYETHLNYDKEGRIILITQLGSLDRTITYDFTYLKNQINIKMSQSDMLVRLSEYYLDDAGLIKETKELYVPSSSTTHYTFTYDPNGHLTRVEGNGAINMILKLLYKDENMISRVLRYKKYYKLDRL